MTNRFKATLMIVAGVLSILISISAFWLPKVKAENAPKGEFSAMRAMKHVEKVAAEIHPIESLEKEKVRDYIVSELLNLGLKAEIQKAYVENEIWNRIEAGNIENIYVTLEGSSSDKDTILMMAHYDSTEGGPGAGDDASGVASLLEIISILKAKEPLRNDIIFLFSDGEEEGLLGAKAFVDSISLTKDIDLVINLEARGNSGPAIMFETADNNGWYMREFKKAVKEPVAYSFSYEVYKNMDNETDFTKFKEVGKSGFNFACISGAHTYHSEEDTPENLNKGTLQHMGDNALSLGVHFGNLDLGNKQGGNAVYFTAAKSVLILYSENLALPLALITLVLFILVIIVGKRRKELSIRGTIVGFVISLTSVAVGYGIGFTARAIFRAVGVPKVEHFSTSDVEKIFTVGGIYLIAAVVVSLIVFSIIFWLLQKKVSLFSLLQGTLAVWVILTFVSSIMFKSASYIFTLPAMVLLLGLTIRSIVEQQKHVNIINLITFILVALVVCTIFIPLCYLMYLSMMPVFIPVLAATASLPLGLVALSGMAVLWKEKAIATADDLNYKA